MSEATSYTPLLHPLATAVADDIMLYRHAWA